MYKKLFGMILTVMTAAMMCQAAFAGEWKLGVSRPNDWWFDNGDGTYLKDGWHWVDGNRDGIAECYYFDDDGWMLANTITPDNYRVNESGAWVENGVVQFKRVDVSPQGTGPGVSIGGSASASSSVQQPETTDNAGQSNTASGFYGNVYSGGGTWEDCGNGPFMKYLKADGTYAQPGEKIEYLGTVYWFTGEGTSSTPVEGYYTPAKTVSEIYEEQRLAAEEYASKQAAAKEEEMDRINNIDAYAFAMEMIELANEKRAAKGLDELEIDDRLMSAAEERAEELAEKYAHTRPDGRTGSTIAAEHDYFTGYYGEICAKNHNTPKAAIQAWLDSPAHKKIMMTEKASEIGAAIYVENGIVYAEMIFGKEN